MHVFICRTIRAPRSQDISMSKRTLIRTGVLLVMAVMGFSVLRAMDIGKPPAPDPSPRRPASETFLARNTPQGVQRAVPASLPDDGKLRIIVFGAHPDDAEYKCGGSAAKWAGLGHHVKLVSVTNGDIGHWNM